MRQSLCFLEAEPLLNFIEKNKEKIIGQKLHHYFSEACSGISESPVVFMFETFSIIVDYVWCSDMTVYVVNNESILADNSLNFLYRDSPGSEKLTTWVRPIADFPFIGKEIVHIEIERFSHETWSPKEGSRQHGGDYFSTVTVSFHNGRQLHFCAADSILDGYIEVWYE